MNEKQVNKKEVISSWTTICKRIHEKGHTYGVLHIENKKLLSFVSKKVKIRIEIEIPQFNKEQKNQVARNEL